MISVMVWKESLQNWVVGEKVGGWVGVSEGFPLVGLELG
jgi:hypothetical protein